MLTRQEYINFLVANGIPASQASSQAESIYGQGQSVASGLASGFQGGGAQVAQGTPSLDDYINNPFLSGTGGLTAPTDPRPANWDTQIFGGGGPQPETLPSLDDILKLVDWDGIFSANSGPQVLSGSKPVPQPESQPRYRPDDTGVGIRNPTVLSGTNPTAQPEQVDTTPRRIVDPNNPQTNGGTMPQQTQLPGGGYYTVGPNGELNVFDDAGNPISIQTSENTGGTTTGTSTQGSNTSDPTGGVGGFLAQLLGTFFGSGGGGAGATAQQTQGQEQTATGGNSTATGGNATNTIDLTDLVTVGPSTNTVGDLTTGASTATVGNVGSNVNLSDLLGDMSNTVDLGGAVTVGPSTQNVNTQGTVGNVTGGNASVNTAGTVGNVTGGQGGLGGQGGSVTLSDLLNTAGMFQSGAVSGGAGGTVTNSGNLDTSGMFQSGAVQGGMGGSSTVNTAGTVGNVAGGNASLNTAGTFGDVLGGSLDTSGMFQSGAVQGGNASVNTDGLGNAISSIFAGGGLLDNIIGGGANYAAGEAYKNANKETLDFIKDNTIKNLDPFRTMGTNQIPNLEKEVGNPVMNDVRAGQQSLTAPTAVKTDVNQINPFDANDPALKYLIDQGTRAVENSRAASGKANSGGTLEALQELGQGAALNRSGELARIGQMRDNASLARDNQYFGQQLGNFQAGLQGNDQLFGQLFSQNNQNLGFDQNAYNQLAGIVGMGQDAAAGQGSNATANAGIYNGLLNENVSTRAAQGFGLADLLRGFF